MWDRNASGLFSFPAMKHFILTVLVVLTCIVNTPQTYALFGHTAVERQRRIATEQQLSQEHHRLDAQQRLTFEQQQKASRWQITAFILGIATVLMLMIGTAIGSRGRRHATGGE